MRFVDNIGSILETNNQFVIEQMKKNPEKYKEVKPKPKKAEPKTEKQSAKK